MNTAVKEDAHRLHGELLNALSTHQATLFVHDAADLTALWKAGYQHQGLREESIARRYRHLTGYVLDKAPSHAATVSDSIVLVRLATDMARSGSIYNTYRIVQRPNGPVIVFKGQPHLRRVLNAPVYRLTNPKVIAMGVGKEALRSAARTGFRLTVIVSATTRTIEWLFLEKGSFHSVIGSVSTDIAKALTVTGTGLVGGLIFAGGGVAVAPVALGLGVAVVTGSILDLLDDELKVTLRLTQALVEKHEDWKVSTEPARRQIRYYFGTTPGQVDFMRHFLRRGL